MTTCSRLEALARVRTCRRAKVWVSLGGDGQWVELPRPEVERMVRTAPDEVALEIHTNEQGIAFVAMVLA